MPRSRCPACWRVLCPFRPEMCIRDRHKPEAPIPRPFGDVSVRIERGWHRVFVAVGSNMGDKEYYLEKGLKELKEHPLCRCV